MLERVCQPGGRFELHRASISLCRRVVSLNEQVVADMPESRAAARCQPAELVVATAAVLLYHNIAAGVAATRALPTEIARPVPPKPTLEPINVRPGSSLAEELPQTEVECRDDPYHSLGPEAGKACADGVGAGQSSFRPLCQCRLRNVCYDTLVARLLWNGGGRPAPTRLFSLAGKLDGHPTPQYQTKH